MRFDTAEKRSTVVAGAAVVLTGLCVLSLAAGSRAVPLVEVYRAVADRGMTNPQVEAIVWGVRLPRTICAVLVGPALGLSGALMQGLTRNPLADPGLLGVSAGASFAIVTAVAGFGVTSASGYVWFGFAGAFLAAIAVHLLGGLGPGRRHPGQTGPGRDRPDLPARVVHQRDRAAASGLAGPLPVLVGRFAHRRRPGAAVADGAVPGPRRGPRPHRRTGA